MERGWKWNQVIIKGCVLESRESGDSAGDVGRLAELCYQGLFRQDKGH